MSESRRAVIVAEGSDRLGTVNRVVSLLRAKGFHVLTFFAARTHRPGVARFIVVVDRNATRPQQVIACLDKLADLWHVHELTDSSRHERELALAVIRRPSGSSLDRFADLVSTGVVRIVDSTETTVMVEAVGPPRHIDQLPAVLGGAGADIIDLVRLGPLALSSSTN